jgi:ribA/ribD-fused uncharacterized protein
MNEIETRPFHHRLRDQFELPDNPSAAEVRLHIYRWVAKWSPSIVFGHGRPAFSFLSNFFRTKLIFRGIKFGSSEQAYQYQKSDDEGYRAEILAARTPALAFRAGRKRKKLRPDWDSMRIPVMTEIVKAKFDANDDIRQLLMATGATALVEANCQFWGSGRDNTGTNHLGHILMALRNEYCLRETGKEAGALVYSS